MESKPTGRWGVGYGGGFPQIELHQAVCTRERGAVEGGVARDETHTLPLAPLLFI